MLLKTISVEKIEGVATNPSSKPETQRAILAATLAKGKSIIYNDLRCLETESMKGACKLLGAKIIEHENHLEVHGTGGDFKQIKSVVNALGSGLVFRVMTALASVPNHPTVITGDKILRRRVMNPLFVALKELGVNIEHIAEPDHAPIINWGGGFNGGNVSIQGNISSQFITAILFVAPFGNQKTTLKIEGEILSLSYIKQTIEVMRLTGIMVEIVDNYSTIIVHPGKYACSNFTINGDYTSSSYLIVAAAIKGGKTTLQNMNSQSLQGERKIIDIVKTLGVEVSFDHKLNEMTIITPAQGLMGDFEFDASDYPNIVPTLAVLGAYVEGKFKLVGGKITRLHKSPRIKAIISELQKMGVTISPIVNNGVYDGFEIIGKRSYPGGRLLSSWGDHRIFMSLFVASMGCENSNYLEGYDDVHCSFPDFFDQFNKLGAKFMEVNENQANSDIHEDCEYAALA